TPLMLLKLVFTKTPVDVALPKKIIGATLSKRKLREVVAITFPPESRSEIIKGLVEVEERGTEALKAPEPFDVAVVVPLPPIIRMSELASAVPETVIGE